MTPSIHEPVRSLKALAGLRESIRRAFLIEGAVAVALMASGLVLSVLLIDYLLVLPRGVRAVLLAGVFGYLAWLAFRKLLWPSRLPLPDHELAVLVEARSPELAQALITAVELSRPGTPGAEFVSSHFIEEVVKGVEESPAAIRPHKVVDFRTVRQNGTVLALVVLVLAVVTVLRPALVGIGVRRLFLLADLDWPKRTKLEMLSPLTNPVLVAAGEDLSVQVRVVRGAPSRVEIEADQKGLKRWRDSMSEGAGGVYRKVFENVNKGFRFRVSGGDDELEEVQVEVRLQPLLTRLDVWYRYPESTGLEPTPPDKPVSNPSAMVVPQGTDVALRAYIDLPVSEAYFTFKPREEVPAGAGAHPRSAAAPGSPEGDPPAGGAPAPWPEPEAKKVEVLAAAPRPPPFEPGGPAAPPADRAETMIEHAFTVGGDGAFYFQLRSADGFPGRKGKMVSVRGIPDRAPTVKIIEPGGASEEVSPEAMVPMQFLVRDNYGVRSASLEALVVPAGSEKGEPLKFPLPLSSPDGAPAASPRDAQAEYRPKLTIDLTKVRGIVPGAKFQYYAQADDFGGLTGRSEGYVLHILTKEELKRILNDRLMLLRDQLREIAREEGSVRKDLRDYQDELAKKARDSGKPRSLDAAAAARLVRNHQDQGRITNRLTRVVNDFDQIISKLDSNRVGDEKEKSWIAGLREEVDGFAVKRSPAIEKTVEDLRMEAIKESQSPDRVTPIVEDERKLEWDLEALAHRLTQFGDVNWVIQQLRDVKKRQEEIRDQTRDKARKEAPGAKQGEGSGPEGDGLK
jgi:hypothetical protein